MLKRRQRVLQRDGRFNFFLGRTVARRSRLGCQASYYGLVNCLAAGSRQQRDQGAIELLRSTGKLGQQSIRVEPASKLAQPSAQRAWTLTLPS